MNHKHTRYTTILHEIRIDLNLSLNEYCLADIIYHLSNNPNSKMTGWCYASKEYLSEFLGISERGVYKMLNKLIEKGLIEKDKDTKWLRTSSAWYEKVITQNTKTDHEQSAVVVNKVQSKGEQSAVERGEQSAYNNNIYNNNNILSATADDVENNFNSDHYLSTLVNDKQPHIRLIGYYLKQKGCEFPNKQMANDELKRHLRSASKLVKNYTEERINHVLEYFEKQEYEWTLETVLRKINIK